MKTEIINGVPTQVCETVEEAMEDMWSKDEQEAFHIEERLDEIRDELEMARDAVGEFLGQNETMLEKVATSILELKQERAELKKRLRELAEK